MIIFNDKLNIMTLEQDQERTLFMRDLKLLEKKYPLYFPGNKVFFAYDRPDVITNHYTCEWDAEKQTLIGRATLNIYPDVIEDCDSLALSHFGKSRHL